MRFVWNPAQELFCEACQRLSLAIEDVGTRAERARVWAICERVRDRLRAHFEWAEERDSHARHQGGPPEIACGGEFSGASCQRVLRTTGGRRHSLYYLVRDDDPN